MILMEAVQSAGIGNATQAMGRPTCAILPHVLRAKHGLCAVRPANLHLVIAGLLPKTKVEDPGVHGGFVAELGAEPFVVCGNRFPQDP